MASKVLTVEDLEQIEKILEIILPDNAVISIREMSAEERDFAESGKVETRQESVEQVDETQERIVGLVAQYSMLRVGDNAFRLMTDFTTDSHV